MSLVATPAFVLRMDQPKYFAAPNPKYPSEYAPKPWAVFKRMPDGAVAIVSRPRRAGEILDYTTEKAATRKAAELNEAEG